MNIRILKIISMLWASSILGSASVFITQILIARNLSVYDFGLFMMWLTVMNFVVPLIGFGTPQLWLKVFGKEGYRGYRWVKPSYLYLLFSSLFMLFLFVAYLAAASSGTEISLIVLMLLVYAYGQVAFEFSVAIYQLEENYKKVSIIHIAQNAIRLVALIVLIFYIKKVSVLSVASVYAITSLLMLFYFSTVFKNFSKQKIKIKGHENDVKNDDSVVGVRSVVSNSWPFGLGTMSHIIYYQSGIVFSKFSVGNEAAGEYVAALALITATYLLPIAIFQRYLMPKMHRWAVYDREKLLRTYKTSNYIVVFTGIGIMCIYWLLSEHVITLLYGEKFKAAEKLVVILSFSIPFMFQAFNSGSILTTGDLMKTKVKFMLIVGLVSLIGNTLALNYNNVELIAWISVGCNILLCVLYNYGVRNLFLKKIN